MHGNQFDLQIGAGGTGAFNQCAGGSGSMFAGGLMQPLRPLCRGPKSSQASGSCFTYRKKTKTYLDDIINRTNTELGFDHLRDKKHFM